MGNQAGLNPCFRSESKWGAGMARKSKPAEQLSKEGKQFYEALGGESTLACVLIGAAALEQGLISLLARFFIEGQTSEKFLSEGGALGDFKKCADAAYCLGLIPKELYQNLCWVGEIRNLFAHSHLPIDFTDSAVVQLCNKLILSALPKGIFDDYVKTPRNRFSVTVSDAWSKILLTALGTKRRERHPGWTVTCVP